MTLAQPLTDLEIADVRAAFADPYNNGLCDDDKMWRGARSDVPRLLATITSLQSGLQRTREALRPFAAAGSMMDLVRLEDDRVVYTPVIDANFCITAGDLRKANAALTPPTGT